MLENKNQTNQSSQKVGIQSINLKINELSDAQKVLESKLVSMSELMKLSDVLTHEVEKRVTTLDELINLIDGRITANEKLRMI